MDVSQWEKLCKGCGKCCFEKLEEDDGTIHYTALPCAFLDEDTRQCTIYERRSSVMKDCLTLTEDNLPELYWLPETCGYVEYYRRKFGQGAWQPKARVYFD